MDFYRKVKKLCKSSAMLLAVIFGIIGIVFMVIGFKGFMYQVGPTVDFNDADLDDLEPGTYVKGEFKLCYGAIGEYYETKNGTTSVNGYLYVFGVPGESYYDITYVPVKVSSTDATKARRIMNQTSEATGLFGINEKKLTESFEFEGIISDNTDYDEMGLFKEEAYAGGFEDDELTDFFLNTETNKIPLLVSFGFGIMFLMFGAIPTVLYMSGMPTKKIKAYIKARNLNGREEFLLNDFENGMVVAKNVRMGKDYAYYGKGLSARMFAYEDIVWAYVDTVRVKNSVTFQLALFDRNKKKELISFTKKENSDAACGAILAANPGIIVGKTPELQQLFKKNFAELIRMADEKKASIANQPETDSYTEY